MKHEIGDIWKSGNEWIVQFPKGRMHFKTKKVAMKWVNELKKEGK